MSPLQPTERDTTEIVNAKVNMVGMIFFIFY